MQAESIYQEFGVPTAINAAGTRTRIGGSRIRPEAVDAMSRAATSFVRLSDLQAAASDRIAEVTGAEAGYVTNGAAGALVLAAAACIARDDPAVMNRLPDTRSVPDEIVMPRTHRTGYDHALRAAGASIVDIGTNDRELGTGAQDVRPWEYREAISENTVAVAHMAKPHTSPDLGTVCDIAHDAGIPVIVDAAAELPPRENLSQFIEQGADLVAFSGGKAIRGPQTTGILAGRRELIRSVALQQLDMHVPAPVWDPPASLIDVDCVDGVPQQGIGRPLKVGKEELVGLLRALDLFLEEDRDALRETWRDQAKRIAEALASEESVTCRINDGPRVIAPKVIVSFDRSTANGTATALVRRLRDETPRIFVDDDDIARDRIGVNPQCLTDDEIEYVIERIRANLPPHQAGQEAE